uniref:Uncharacterized protein n=1 Tax=Chromera velia CCMP2878 TaxID=1169474 RepID=A0A0G4H1P5_9ALVE|eukprot:Cvel_814.t1-p1 / transcript=Cvel_814.t1 / gene=Cvel_814 / organism=Chromera_velia_CCMP2878 / gene_product=hypothetical protein / transcript_product=hypothetical protein / location=Cvel_scaffold25:119708-120319(-) / protein_length=204 / sequence_SO=supercontig / SO=protein_coding / is_pseudo=false
MRSRSMLEWGVRMNPFRAVWGHMVTQSISKPSRRVFKMVVCIIEMLKGHPDKRVFTSVELVPVVHAYFDAAFKFTTYAARLGYVIRILHSIELRGDLRSLLENWIAWATKRAGRKVGSSTAGEVLAFEFLLKKLFGIVALVKAMWGLKKVHMIIYTDSGPLHDQFHTGRFGVVHSGDACPWGRSPMDCTIEEHGKRDDQVRPPR